jgi:hypothetical protein
VSSRRRTKRTKEKMADSDAVADAVGSNDTDDTEYDVYAEETLRVMVVTVAFEKGFEGISGSGWVKAVVDKLNSVGVKTLKDMIRQSTTINQTLGAAGHARFHRTTLRSMMETIVKMVLGLENGADV